MVNTFLFCLLSCLCKLAQPQQVLEVVVGDCAALSNSCTECISGTYPSCSWCTQQGYEVEGRSRCDLVTNLQRNGCNDTNIIFPESMDSVTKAVNLTEGSVGPNEEAVQIYPQEMYLKIRRGDTINVKVKYKQAEDYPVDLYYLMDLSNSMYDDKKKLGALGQKLADTMSKITKNFKLGFGSFIDKVTAPYVSEVPEKLECPCCPTNDRECVPPYSFKNHLPLTDETDLFAKKVDETKTSGNLDSPEGGMDALVQAIICHDDIGWRPNARHLVVFSTDASFHIAGDGKLGGIVKPNDGRCHMENGEYIAYLEQDYPSVGQLIKLVSEEKVNIIFAVTERVNNTYLHLSKLFEGSSVGVLADDSSNIVDLVRENYEKISSSISMGDDLTPPLSDYVNLEYSVTCKDKIDFKTCTGIKVGDEVDFDIGVTLVNCPPDGKPFTFSIKPRDFQEELKITVEPLCECKCAMPEQEERNSSRCSHQGTFECGICSCDPTFYGQNCSCQLTSEEGPTDTEACRVANSTQLCSGLGTCLCGRCYCQERENPEERIYGPQCQCNNFSCGRYKNQICGGSKRGICDCGKCMCQPQYTGSKCECPSSKAACMAENGKECNGLGTCICGGESGEWRCKCNSDSKYHGPTCEDCVTCKGFCEKNRYCVECRVHKSGPLIDECDEKCNSTEIELIDTLPETQQRCQYRDENGCTYRFAYELDATNDVILKVEKDLICPEPVNAFLVVGGVIGGIIGIGLLLLLIWKLLTTIHDKREYAKFEQERQKAKWEEGENPLYKKAVTETQNPTYGD